MLLAIDIGNSSITTGIFAGEFLLGKIDVPTHYQGHPTHYRREIEVFLSKKKVEKPLSGVIISSVVPELTDVFERSVREISVREPVTVVHSLNTGLTFDVESPGEVGADRISDAVAALEIFGSPVAVVDFGTATTISAVRDRRFLGGAILPGLRLMGEALHEGTAKLPFVDSAIGTKGPASAVTALGKNTAMNILSGMIYGTSGAVERIIRGIEKEQGCAFKVVITGGNAFTIVPYMERECSVDPDLTLRGLRLIYERNA